MKILIKSISNPEVPYPEEPEKKNISAYFKYDERHNCYYIMIVVIQELVDYIDIPVVLSIVSLDENLEERMLHTGASIINVSGGKKTAEIVRELRKISPNFPIIATGGPTVETIQEVIDAGANAITYTPPTNGDIFKLMMEKYRHSCHRD